MYKDIIPKENAQSKELGNYPNYPTGTKGAKLENSSDKALKAQDLHLEKWYDNYDVQKMFHISQRTLQTLRSKGKLPFTKLGNKCFYREQDLQYMMMESFRDSRVKFSEQKVPDKENGKKGEAPWE